MLAVLLFIIITDCEPYHISLLPGFKEQIYDVYRYLPPATQVVLISATLPHEILEMTNKFMTDPIRILVKRYGTLFLQNPDDIIILRKLDTICCISCHFWTGF